MELTTELLEGINTIFQRGEGTIIGGQVVTGWAQCPADVQAAAEAAGLYRPAPVEAPADPAEESGPDLSSVLTRLDALEARVAALETAPPAGGKKGSAPPADPVPPTA